MDWFQSNNRHLTMTFVIPAFRMYVLHFGHFSENRKNSGLTPGQNDDPVTRTLKMTQMTHWPGDPMTQFHVWSYRTALRMRKEIRLVYIFSSSG